MPFTLRNLKEDLEDLGSNFDGAPDLEFRLATVALVVRVGLFTLIVVATMTSLVMPPLTMFLKCWLYPG